MGFWIWWFKRTIIPWFIFIVCISTMVAVVLAFKFNIWFFIYPLAVLIICVSILAVDYLIENIIEPIKKYIVDKKKEYRKENPKV